MDGPTPPGDIRTKTLPLFGRRLQNLFGDAVVGMDKDMLGLLEQLLDVPGVSESAHRSSCVERSQPGKVGVS